MHTTAPHRPRLLRALAALCAAAAVAAVTLLVPGGADAAEPKALFEQVGTLERYPADARAALGERFVPTPDKAPHPYGGTMIAVPRARLLLQLYHAPNFNPTAVVVRDLDSLRLLRTLQLPGNVDRASLTFGGDWSHAVDDKGARLWLYVGSQVVFEIDLRTFAVTRRPVPESILVAGFPLGGMTYDRFADDLLLLHSGPGSFHAANMTTLLYRLDVSKPPPASFPPDELARIYRVRSCTAPVGSTDVGSETLNWDVLADERYLYVPCQRAGHTVIVVRIERSEGPGDANQPEEVAAGPVWGDAVMADQEGGRLIVTTFEKKEIWVFETSTMSFVGVVATGPDTAKLAPTGWGLDTDTGRVFFQSPHFGLGIVEARFFPLPQARTFSRAAPGRERIWSDAATNRVFVLEGTENLTTPRAPAYKVYRVLPAPKPPAAPDPDRNTANVDEKPGVTEARFNATGSGYGSRVLLAKGIGGVPPAPAFGGDAPSTGVPSALNNTTIGGQAVLPCTYTDRDVFAGRVAKAEYDTGSTAAQAAAVAVDDTTKQDLNQPARCGLLGLLGPAGVRWDYRSATCASNEGMEKAPPPATGEDHGSPVKSFGPSRAVCPLPKGILEAEAETKLTSVNVEVQRSKTTTRIQNTSAGVVSTVESIAQGVTLGGVPGMEAIRIGEIRSKAVSTSNGRPKRGDMSTHDITVGDVVVGTTRLCEATGCDPVQLENRLNLLAGGRALFRTGHGANSGRDDALVTGSDRGAQTAVQKSVARQASDRALIGDFTVEVPALEVTVFNDNKSWGRARQLYQFAGVTSSATYNVVPRPTSMPFDELGGLPDEPVAAAAAVGDTPFAGLAESLEGGVGGGTGTYATAPAVDGEDDGGSGGIFGAVRAVARGLRLFLSSPRTALLLLSAWALLGSPAVLSRRRRLLDGVRTN